ncbi:9-O-acetylesterase [candidate division KSB1 bacterium]|nr:9-O-acetylesterase [candidate division KSB1 bacterium]
MNSKLNVAVVCCIAFLMLASCSLFRDPATNIRLSALFGDKMVLQRDISVPVWGTADPGGKVRVMLDNQELSTTVGETGKWRVELPARSQGGPFELVIIGKDTIRYKNVMVGEVWICSGQSNMEMPLADWGKVLNYEQEIAAADHPNIRLFKVNRTMSELPRAEVNSTGWHICTPAAIPDFSAVAYFFGRHLDEKLDLPIGLIQTAWGGTVAEAWTSTQSLKQLPDFAKLIEEIEKKGRSEEQILEVHRERLAAWNRTVTQRIDSLGGFDRGWQNPVLSLDSWKTMNLPAFWENAGLKHVDGLVWFRKSVMIPETWKGEILTLNIGPINDLDNTWFNGVRVGGEGHCEIERHYPIPDSLFSPGENVIAIQVLDIGNYGGLYGLPEQLSLASKSHGAISLAGNWYYRVDPLDINLKTLPAQPPTPHNANRPSVLFNGMISPLLPYAIRGAIWYQGESNAGRAFQYRSLFPAMITDWRSHWGQGDFPFLFVQLANFGKLKSEPADDAWAELREAQLMTLSLPNTGMALAIDIGEAFDIHPKNKQEVGRRLALNALGRVYGKNIVFSGPIYKSMKVEANTIRLTFDHIDGGLSIQNGSALKGFAIAGHDSVFHWANARIDGETVVVSHPQIAEPVAVRYGWAMNPVCNLYNKAGLPASPFRTDDWKGITRHSK